MRFAVPDNDKLAAGDYQFLAIGREATDNYRISTPVVGTTKINDMIAHITTPGQESEIFAGTLQLYRRPEIMKAGASVNKT